MQAATIRVREGPSDELAVIALRAQAFTNASGTAIALSEGNADEMICHARAGPNAPEVGTALRLDGTFTGLCVQSGRELCCDDAETDSRVDQAAIRALGIRSIVAIPIKEAGQVVGVLAVFAPAAHAFGITHVAVLKILADQIADYVERQRRGEAYAPEPLPAPPVKAVAASPAAPPAPPPESMIKPAVPASVPRQFPVAPKVERARAGRSAARIDPGPPGKQRRPINHAQQKEYKTDFRPAFRTLEAVAAAKRRLGANVLMIGAAAVVVIAVAVGLSFKLRRADAAPQPAPETSSSPAPLTTPAPASPSVQPPAKSSPLGPLVNQEDAQPKRVVVLTARSSRISLPQPANSARVGDNSAPPSDAPVILGSVPASGSLSNLAGPVSPARPRLLTQSNLEPATVIKRVQPVYPSSAKQQGLRGSVVVKGIVGKNGRITELKMISGLPLFRNAAFDAVKQWVFKPATLNGQPIEQTTTIRLDFSAQ